MGRGIIGTFVRNKAILVRASDNQIWCGRTGLELDAEGEWELLHQLGNERAVGLAEINGEPFDFADRIYSCCAKREPRDKRLGEFIVVAARKNSQECRVSA